MEGMETQRSVKIRKPYEPHERVQLRFEQPSLTKQSMAAETDINVIMAKYQRTGLISHWMHGGSYEDLTNATNYHDAMNMILDAQDAFMQLPARVRKHFGNDPAQLMAAIDDPSRADELRELGILAEVPEPVTGTPEPGREPDNERSEASVEGG